MINEMIVPEMMENFQFDLYGDILFEDLLWFQDGAPPHCAANVTVRLQSLFGENVEALHRNIEWPARSHHLT